MMMRLACVSFVRPAGFVFSSDPRHRFRREVGRVCRVREQAPKRLETLRISSDASNTIPAARPACCRGVSELPTSSPDATGGDGDSVARSSVNAWAPSAPAPAAIASAAATPIAMSLRGLR